MVRANFTDGNNYTEAPGLTQWDYGQVLEIHGLDLPKAVEIHFAIYDCPDDAIIRIGNTVDKITRAAIPEKIMEQSQCAVAYVYVSDTQSGETVRTVYMPMIPRQKPEAFDAPEDAELFKETIEMVNAAADRAELAKSDAETARDVAQSTADETEADRAEVEALKSQAQTAAESALLSEHNANVSETAAQTAQAGAETAEGQAELFAGQAEESKNFVEAAKAVVMELGQKVADDKSNVEQAVSDFEIARQNAVKEIKAAENAALENIGTGIDDTLTQSGKAADAKETGDKLSKLKDDLVNLENVLEIEKDLSASKNINATTDTILADIEMKTGVQYTATFTIDQPSAYNVYVKATKTGDDSAITSRQISVGSTSVSFVFNGEDGTFYVGATTYESVNVSVVITSNEAKENAIERLDRRINEFNPETPTVQTKVAYGYNIKGEAETGEGAYYWQSGKPFLNTSGSYGTDYTYFIFNVNKNSVYSTSVTPRWIILVDENGNKVSDTLTGKMIRTGNATKLYLTMYNTYLNQFAISEGYLANYADKTVIFGAEELENRHGNSIPMDIMYFSTGIPEKLYYNNILAIDTDRLSCITSCNRQDSHDNDGITITPISAFSNTSNAVRIEQFDNDLNLVYKPQPSGLVIKELNLKDCSALVIGDSTVGSWGTMTQAMLDFFAENGKTLTLLGTRGQSDLNRHEGRGGWSAKAYCTEETHGDYTNPFLNNGEFDFSYYMTQQGYSTPDFVGIQLGINDVSNTDIDDFKTVSEQALAYEKQMIDSILAYDSNIKIIINPPTTPNLDSSKLSMYYETTVFRNIVIRYAMMLRRLALQYSNNNVRCSNTNLILDTRTEIRDNVHPTEEGFIKMGKEVCNQINCWQN